MPARPSAASTVHALARLTFALAALIAVARSAGAAEGSLVSPACVEVTASQSLDDSSVAASSGGAGVAVAVYGQRLVVVELPLSPVDETPVDVVATDVAGTRTNLLSTSRQWTPIDIINSDGGQTTIRAGDSLLLTTHGPGALAISYGATPAAAVAHPIADGERLPTRFGQPGDYTVSATDDGSTVGSYTVHVVGAPFAGVGPLPCELNFQRSLAMKNVVGAMHLVFTSSDTGALTVSGGGATYTSATATYKPLQRGRLFIIARIDSTSGPVVAAKEVDEFQLDRLVASRGILLPPDDKSGGETMSLVRMRPYLPGVLVQLESGSITTSGTTSALFATPLRFARSAIAPAWDPATKETIGWFAFPTSATPHTTAWSAKIIPYTDAATPVRIGSNDVSTAKIRRATLSMTSPTSIAYQEPGAYPNQSVSLSAAIAPDANMLWPELILSGPADSQKFPPTVDPVPLVTANGNPRRSIADTELGPQHPQLAYTLKSFDAITGGLVQTVCVNDIPDSDPGPDHPSYLIVTAHDHSYWTLEHWDEGDAADLNLDHIAPLHYYMAAESFNDGDYQFGSFQYETRPKAVLPEVTTMSIAGRDQVTVDYSDYTQRVQSQEAMMGSPTDVPGSIVEPDTIGPIFPLSDGGHARFTYPGLYSIDPWHAHTTFYPGLSLQPGDHMPRVLAFGWIIAVTSHEPYFAYDYTDPRIPTDAGGFAVTDSIGGEEQFGFCDFDPHQVLLDSNLMDVSFDGSAATSPVSVPAAQHFELDGYEKHQVTNSQDWVYDPITGQFRMDVQHDDQVVDTAPGYQSPISSEPHKLTIGPYAKDGFLVITAQGSTHKHRLLSAKPGLGFPRQSSAAVEAIPGHAWVDVARGNLHFSAPIATFATPADGPDCVVSYNSQDAIETALGRGWRTNYDMQVVRPLGSDTAVLIDETGRRCFFARDAAASTASADCFRAQDGELGTVLYARTSGALPAQGGWLLGERYRLVRTDNRWRFFDALGRLRRIQSLRGDVITVDIGANGFPSKAHDGHSRFVDLRPSAIGTVSNHQLTKLDDLRSGHWEFVYDAKSNATSIKAVARGDSPFSGTGDLAWTVAYEDQAATGGNRVRSVSATGSGLTTWFDAPNVDAGTFAVRHDLGGTTTFTPASHTVTLTIDGASVTRIVCDYGGVVQKLVDRAGVVSSFDYVDGGASLIAFGLPKRIQEGKRDQHLDYDGRGRLVSRVVRGLVATSPDQTTRWAYAPIAAAASTTLPWPLETSLLQSATVVGVGGIEGEAGTVDLVTRYRYVTAPPALGELQVAIDADGAATTYAYDGDGFVSKITDARGKSTTVVSHDTYGQPTQWTLPNGLSPQATADPDGVTRTAVDGLGFSTGYTPDSFRRVAVVDEPGPGTVTTAYDAFGRVTSVTRDAGDGTTQKTTYAYDAFGRCTRAAAPGEAALVTTYTRTPTTGDVTGWTVLTKRETGPDQRQQVTLDAAGRAAKETVWRMLSPKDSTAATPCTTTTAYDPVDGWAATVTDPDGGITRLAYDGFARVRQVTDAVGGVTATTFNAAGDAVAVKDVDGHTTTRAIDRCGHPVTTINPAGGWSQTLYDAIGGVVATRSGAGRGERFAYDDPAFDVQRIDAFGVARASKAQLAAGAPAIVETGPGGQTTTTKLDDQGRPATVDVTATGLAAPLETKFAYPDNHGSRTVTPPGRGDTGVEIDAVGHLKRSYLTGTVGASAQQIATSYTWHATLGVATGTSETFGLATQALPASPTGEVNQTTDNHNGDDSGPQSPSSTVMTRNKRGLTLTWTDGRGLPWSQDYDALGRAKTRQSPDGIVTGWFYSKGGSGAMVVSVDVGPAGTTPRTTTYVHDVLGDVTAVIPPGGETVERTFDAYGRMVSETAGGVTTLYQYDPETGALAHLIKPGGRTVDFLRDGRGRVTDVVDADTQRVTYHYDELDRLVGTDFPDGRSEARAYDPVSGDVATLIETGTSTSGSAGTRSVAFTRDLAGRVTKATYDDGTVVTYGLSKWVGASGVRGKLLTATRRKGGMSSAVTRRLDRGSQTRSFELPGQAALTSTYTATGELLTRSDGSSTRSFTYDSGTGQLVTLTDGDTTAKASYNARGELDQLLFPTAPGGFETVLERHYGYDTAGRLETLTQTLPYGSETSTVSRDALGRVQRLTVQYGAPEGTVATDFSYDALARLVLEHVTGSQRVIRQYAYDIRGNRTAQRIAGDSIHDLTRNDLPLAPGPGTTSWTTGSETVLRIATHVTAAPTTTGAPDPELVATVLLGTGQGAAKGFPGAYAVQVHALSVGSATERWLELRWQPSGAAEEVIATSDIDSDTVGDLVISLQPSGVHAEISSTTGRPLVVDGATNYQITGALAFGCSGTSATGASFAAIAAETAPQSAIALTTYDYYAGDRMKRATTKVAGATTTSAAYSIDAFGRLTREVRTGSGAGTTNYGYDRLDRLTSLSKPGLSAAYTYYGDSWMRASATENGAATTFAWDGRDLVSSTADGVTTTYGHLGSQPLWSRRGGATTYNAYDILGNVDGRVCQIATSESGTVWALAQKYRCDAWGNLRQFNISGAHLSWSTDPGFDYAEVPVGTVYGAPSGSPLQAPGFAWKSEWRDQSGLTYLRHRMYDPGVGRFTQSDPAKAGTNWFAYCGNDPVNRVDPMGLEWELRYKIDGDATPPLFTVNAGEAGDQVEVSARWIPEPNRPLPPNPKGWQELFQSIGPQLDAYLRKSPEGAIIVPAVEPVPGFNDLDFGQGDAYSASDRLSAVWDPAAAGRLAHSTDRAEADLLASVAADPASFDRQLSIGTIALPVISSTGFIGGRLLGFLGSEVLATGADAAAFFRYGLYGINLARIPVYAAYTEGAILTAANVPAPLNPVATAEVATARTGTAVAQDVAVVGAQARRSYTALSDQQLLEEIAARAEAAGIRAGKGAAGTGPLQGTWKHTYAKRLLDKYKLVSGQRQNLVTEQSYANGVQVDYGTPGSSRPDVFDIWNGIIYDYKFVRMPGLGIPAAQQARNLQNVPGVTQQIEINP